MKLFASLVLASALLAGCGAERERMFSLVKPEEMCIDSGTVCQHSRDCCSQWCVNGYCERREP